LGKVRKSNLKVVQVINKWYPDNFIGNLGWLIIFDQLLRMVHNIIIVRGNIEATLLKL